MDQPVHPSAPPLDHARIRAIMIGCMLAMFLGALDQTIVVTALPTIGRELGAFNTLSWIITAYLLSSTAVTPLYGKLSDVHGRRTMLLIAIAVFVGGSIVCALSRDIFTLVIGRAAQGLGGGGLMSLGQTIIGDVIPPRERGRYIGYLSANYAIASIAGPVLGGVFAQHSHWSVIFWINVPLGILAYVITHKALRLLPRYERPHRIDILGALLIVTAAVSLLLALSLVGGPYRWASAHIRALLAASAIASALFAWRMIRAPEPFIPISVLSNPVVRNGMIALFFTVGTMIALSVYVPQYFEIVLHLSADQSGLALIALMGGTVVGATLAGRAMARLTHYKRIAVMGLGVASVTMSILAMGATRLPIEVVELVLAIAGMGIGAVFPIAMASIQNAVTPQQMGTAMGVQNLFRSLGGAILVAVLGAIFLASAAGDSSLQSIQAVIDHGEDIDFSTVFRNVFLGATLALLLALGFVTLMNELPLRGRSGS